MIKLKTHQVGELLQAIYDTETHLKIEWMWDGGFNFAYGCFEPFNQHPEKVNELYKTIDSTKIEEVASLILLEFQINHSVVDTKGNLNAMGKFIKRIAI